MSEKTIKCGRKVLWTTATLMMQMKNLILLDDRAQYNLGICYEKGTGVECDIDKAVSLYTAAAKKGNKNAIAALERLGK